MIQKLNLRQYLVIASMIFALFFGAGNLIFPLHLGQLAGRNWLIATIGFLITGVLLPLFSVLAIAITKTDDVYGIAKPVSNLFATCFMILIHLTLGIMCASPRTASVSYSVGIAPLLPSKWHNIGLVIFTAIYFILTFIIAYNAGNILENLGKILNPIFLVLLFLVIIIALFKPLGNPADFSATASYVHSAGVNGFLEGYNTIDALAGIAFGVSVISAVKSMGITEKNEVAKITAKSGFIAMTMIGIIYFLLILLGAMSLGKFKVSAEGGKAFSQIVTYYGGTLGQIVLASLVTLTCLTTAVGLVSSFAQDFHSHFGGLKYRKWLAITCFASFMTANLGLELIIKWTFAILMFLYPIAMVLIILALFSPLFKGDHVVYKVSVVLTIIPAFMDLIAHLPAPISETSFCKMIIDIRLKYFPLSVNGLSCVFPTLLGIIIATLVHVWRRKNNKI